MNDVPPKTEQPIHAFSYPNFRLFWAATLLTSFAAQIISVSVGWQIYDLTRDPVYLALVGLAQFLPALLLVLLTGMVADNIDRRVIMLACLGVELTCALALFLYASAQGHAVWPIYVVLVSIGTARAFMSPAASALAPNLVGAPALASAVSLNASAWQLANILGPVAGGLLYGIAGWAAYGTGLAFLLVAVGCLLLMRSPPQIASGQETSIGTLLAGFRYIWSEKIVLGAISLDLFAVLMGGAVALMPVFARDILVVGPWGLGLLRSAPGLGGILMALYLARFPIRDRAGAILFVFVTLFGFFTLLFGLSTSVWLSVPLLALMGASDMVSVSIRETIMQLWTPDEVRGRVSAVNSVFIGASNELGEFRAGMMAALVGARLAVVAGGAATMAIAAIWSVVFPGLRKQGRIDRRMV